MTLQELATIAGNAAYLCSVLAFVMRNILYLRILSTISFCLLVFYFLFYLDKPLWINLIWEILFILINVFQIAILFLDNKTFSFKNEEEKNLYEKVFFSLSLPQFKKFLKIGDIISAEKGTLLTEEGKVVEDLLVISHGIVNVKVKDNIIARCEPGSLIGEISFLTGNTASATMEAAENVRCFKWKQEKLKKLIESDPEIDLAMQTIFGVDLIKKLNPSVPF